MKRIPLTRGKYTVVDDADYDWLNQYKWFALEVHGGNFYAARQSSRKNGRQFMIRMHRQILGLERGDCREGDHMNHNTLDNRQVNIRVCTHQENMLNRKPDSNTTSQFKGVCWYKLTKKWEAQISTNGKRKSLGYFEKEEFAALAYDRAAIKEHGEFACLNFN